MKLNYKRTLFVGFAFFLICAFWQAYDTIVPKILTDRFGMSQFWSGAIMAIDNILALFLLPLFGILSDKTKSKLGRRTPFIIVGTLIAAAALISLSFVDSMQLDRLGNISDINSEEARATLYDYSYSSTIYSPDNKEIIFTEEILDPNIEANKDKIAIGREAFITCSDEDDNYTNCVVPVRSAYIAQEIVGKDPSTLIIFIAVLFVLLLSMATFRTPAVALMPDVTPRPLRSKANAVINLMGTIGGSLILGLGIVLATGATKNTYMPYTGYFCIVAGIMLVSLIIFLSTVREPKFVAEMEKISREQNIKEGNDEDEAAGDRKLSAGERLSLILLLASVVLWFFGYNAVTSKYSIYAGRVLLLDYNSTLLVANIAALIAYLPVGMIASKVGRKKTILAGVVMLSGAFLTASFLDAGTPLPVMMILFAIAGIGWATINVNSFPMVVELARGGNVGKYTGFYYTASMAAQTLTPLLSGLIMDNFGMKTLFPYAAIFAAGAFVTMLFVRHGDSKPTK